jgi:AraC-like DNA-binding protein
MTGVEYFESVPRAELRPFVRVVWSLRGPADPSGGLDRIVPDGCPEIVVNRADPFRRATADGRSHEQARVLLVGQLRRAIEIAPTGAVDLVGVRFEPGGLFALLGMPMHELADVDVALRSVAPRLRDALVDAARDRDLRRAVGRLEVALLEEFELRGRLCRGGAGLVGAAVGLAHRGLPDVGGPHGLAATLGIGRRALERLFRQEVGLSPKLYARIERLQGVLASLEHAAPGTPWAQLALRHGYADQSHLIRDFRLLAGTTPQRYLAERTQLASCFEPRGPSHSSNP